MKHPFLIAAGAGLLVLAAAAALTGWQMLAGPAPAALERGLPWQTEAAGEGRLRVFGLVPGQDTLADVRRVVGDALQVALVARLGEVGALEGFADPFRAGYITGRLVLAFDATPDALGGWRSRAGSSEAMEGGARRFALAASDLAAAQGTRLAGISFLPAAKLDGATVLQRFGEPAQRLGLGGAAQAWLYPARGLAVLLGGPGRDVLQYVAPSAFEARLAAPLAQTAASVVAR